MAKQKKKKFYNSNRTKRSNEGYKESKNKGFNEGKTEFNDPINDAIWYSINEQMLADVARIPYATPVGLPYDYRGSLTAANDPVTQKPSVPGIMDIAVVPTYGNAKSSSDAVNVAANAMFTFIRSRVSGKYDWEANDLMMYIGAVDSLYFLTSFLIRGYGTLPLYHQANRYIARDLMVANGFDYDDWVEHSAEFRAAFNIRIARINALKLPANLYIFKRHRWLFENYYIEGDSFKDQIYFYRPAAYYAYELDSNGAGMLKCHRLLAGGSGQGGRLTTADMLRKLDLLLDAIYDDEYFNLISGYIERAYEGALMQLPYIPDQIIAPLNYNEDVLLQFKNSVIKRVAHATSGTGYLDGFFDIHQTLNPGSNVRMHLEVETPDSAISCYMTLPPTGITDVDSTSSANEQHDLAAVWNEWTKRKILTSPHNSVEPKENMINTRCTIGALIDYDATAVGLGDINELSFCSEWPVELTVFTKVFNETTQQVQVVRLDLESFMLYDMSLPSSENVTTFYLTTISNFKYHPQINLPCRHGQLSASDITPTLVPVYDIDNYTLLSYHSLKMMHESAIMSMFRIPEAASSALGGSTRTGS